MLSGNKVISMLTSTCAIYRTLHNVCHFFGRHEYSEYVTSEKFLLHLTENTLLGEHYLISQVQKSQRGESVINWGQYSQGHPLVVFIFRRPQQILGVKKHKQNQPISLRGPDTQIPHLQGWDHMGELEEWEIVTRRLHTTLTQTSTIHVINPLTA